MTAKDSEFDQSAFSDDLGDEKLLHSEVNMKKSIRQSWVKWVALACACLMLVGNYMCYDYPQYLQTNILWDMFHYQSITVDGKDIDIGDPTEAKLKYSWLYSIYSFPNMIIPLFGGFFVDKLGVRKGCFVFSFVLILGQAICAFSGIIGGDKSYGTTTVYIIMLMGRVVFALGGENLGVAQSAIISKWFFGKQLSFALGVNISISRCGSFVAGVIYGPLYNVKNDLFLPLITGCIMTAVSWGVANVLIVLDRVAGKLKNGQISDAETQEEPIQIKDIKKFPKIYWLIVASCVLNYICVFVFLQFSQDFLTKRYQVDVDKTGSIISLPYIMAACITPFAGLIVDKIGRRQWLLLAASCLNCFIHILFLIMPECPIGTPKCSSFNYYLPFALMGLFYSSYAAVLWPCIPLILDKDLLGTGFGLAFSIQNLGLAVGPQIIGPIQGATSSIGGGFKISSVIFVIFAALSIFVSVLIIFANNKLNNVLGKLVKVGRKSTMNEQQQSSLGAKRSFKN